MTCSRMLILLGLLFLMVATWFLVSAIWHDETRYAIQDLGPISAGQWIEINNRGHVAYSSSKPDGVEAYLWKPGTGSQMIAPASDHAHVHWMSERDVVVGAKIRISQNGTTIGYPRAFVWSATKGMIELNVEGALRSWAFRVGENGEILGRYEVDEGSKAYVVWDAEGLPKEEFPANFLETPDAEKWKREPDPPKEYLTQIEERKVEDLIIAHHGSNGKQSVGYVNPQDTIFDRISDAIRKSNNGFVVILHAALKHLGFPARKSDQVSAYVWEDGEFRDLNDLIPKDSGWQRLKTAVDINDHGQIVGVGMKGGTQRLFLLTPAPPLSGS